MIYQHTFKEADYAIIKLVNGEEVIAKVIDSSKHDITVTDPVQIHRLLSPIGNEMIRCSYWMLFNDSPKVVIQKSHVLTLAQDVSKNTIRHYELFLKHSSHNEVDENLGEMLEQAEQEFKKQIMERRQSEMEAEEFDLDEDDINPLYLDRSSSNTVH